MMTLSTARTPLACVVALLFAAGCGSESSEAPSAHVEAPIIGGTPGGPAQVGRLLWFNPAHSSWNICSGSLVSAELVLTARHCVYDEGNNDTPYLEDGSVVFQLYDSAKNAFSDETKVAETFVPPIVPSDNFASWGEPYGTPDVALFRLATPITRVTPLPIATDPVSLDKPQFTAAGFGFVSHAPDTSAATPPWGLSSTDLVLIALEGQYLHVPYPTFNAFLAAIAAEKGVKASSFSASAKQEYQGYYDGPLAAGFEAYLVGKTNGQPCHGDSGGPLLQQDATGKLQIYGTLSGGLDLDRPTDECRFGEVYSVFGQPAQEFFKAHGLLGMPMGTGSGGAAGASAGGSASAVTGGTGGVGGTSAGDTSTGGADVGAANAAGSGGASAGASFAGNSAGVGTFGSAGAVAGVAGSLGVAGRSAVAVRPTTDSSDQSGCGCHVADRPLRDSSGLRMLAGLVVALVAARRRGRA